ncbi:putative pyrazinamidase/nicotinamidase [Trypanosoma theileri]|uniref:nicotinamidase n=1 Tax=Trypanosoma theileri TaxID=67003 RepID=A0A1X0P2N6_9TRYP|nr:putative pyrazinamidase/nicotinamidase [Trypanosoma theileri]ORC91204.1 putative pyrazinamidase/nicotinamidase [Trypanosoma theileri]
MPLSDVSPVHDALLIVDMQNDFVRPDGALAVPAAPEVIPVINEICRRRSFRAVVLTKDWHPPDHCSFRRSNNNNNNKDNNNDNNNNNGGPWPPHCVRGTPGAELHADLQTAAATHIIHKGVSAAAESYSAFADECGTTTGLAALLRGLSVRRVWICGVAYEYCVYFTARDAVRAGFEVVVLQDATRAVDTTVVPARMLELQREGVVHVNSGVLAEACPSACACEDCCCNNDDQNGNINDAPCKCTLNTDMMCKTAMTTATTAATVRTSLPS